MSAALHLPDPPVEPPPRPGPWPGPTHPTPTHPEPPPRPTRPTLAEPQPDPANPDRPWPWPVDPVPSHSHLAVNGREYLADLDALTTHALTLADRYERQLLAALAPNSQKAGVR